jgi:hypothetical protein
VDIPERLFSELFVGEILRYVGFGQGGLGLVISLHFRMGVGGRTLLADHSGGHFFDHPFSVCC